MQEQPIPLDPARGFRVHLAERLRQLQHDRDWSQRELADALGYHTSTVNQSLKHPASMSDEFIRRVAERLEGFEAEWVRFRALTDPRPSNAVTEAYTLRQQLLAAIDATAAQLETARSLALRL